MTDLEPLREKVRKRLNPKRVPHVNGCEKEAVKLARRWGADEEKAAVAGILHDVTKALKGDAQVRFVAENGIECDPQLLSEPKLLHAVTGAYVAKTDFAQPEDICSAIRWHTTGRAGMTLLEKIIYLADYIEETRDFPGVDKLRSTAYKDIDEAMALGLKMSIEDIRSRGTIPYIETVRAYEYYRRED